MAAGRELGLELVAQLQQVAHVRERVGDLLRTQRTPSPVAALLVFFEGDTELIREQVAETDPLDPKHLRRGVRVEDVSQADVEVPPQAHHVVLGGVERELAGGILEERRERVEAERERIDGEARGGRRDLHQADALDVGVEPVRFRVEGDAGLLRDRLGDMGEPGSVVDEPFLAVHRHQAICPRSSISRRIGRKRPLAFKRRRSCARPAADREKSTASTGGRIASAIRGFAWNNRRTSCTIGSEPKSYGSSIEMGRSTMSAILSQSSYASSMSSARKVNPARPSAGPISGRGRPLALAASKLRYVAANFSLRSFVAPKSSTPSLLSFMTTKLPGCGSAWMRLAAKNGPQMAKVRSRPMRYRSSAPGSDSIASRSVGPRIRPSVTTLLEVRSAIGSGTASPGYRIAAAA